MAGEQRKRISHKIRRSIVVKPVSEILNTLFHNIIKLFKSLIMFCFVLMLCGIAVGVFIFIKVEPEFKEIRATEYSKLVGLNEATFSLLNNTRIFDTEGNQIGEVHSSDYTYVPIDEVSSYIQEGYVAVEDDDFYQHFGISIKGTLRAGIAYIRNKGVITQGGSTITQQVVKNNLLTQDRTFTRKFTEMFLAIDLEKIFTKPQIMEFYVNTNFYGQRCYGVESACQYYFGCSAKDVTLAQAAMIVGISNSPSRYNPVSNEELSHKKKEQVLEIMYNKGVITWEQYQNALNEEIQIVQQRADNTIESYQVSYAIYCAVLQLMEDNGFEFKYRFSSQDEYDSYREKYGEVYTEYSDLIRAGGYDIYTSLNSDIQNSLQDAVDSTLAFSSEKQSNEKYALQSAAVCVDNETGYVVAIVGGRGTNDEYNRAFLSTRQAGSTIKPILDYAPAFETGEYYPSLIVKDEAIPNGPTNASKSYSGNVSLREAVARSINTIAWKTLQDIGTGTGLSYLEKMKFSSLTYADENNLSISLGGFVRGVRVYEMAKAYATLANDGIYSDRTCITKIVHQIDGTIYKDKDESISVYRKDTAYLMTSCLEDVLTSSHGTGRKCNLDGQVAAAKTGTTNSNKDGWFCGYTKYYTTSVWVGRDDAKPVDSLSGSSYPGSIWKTFMDDIHEGLEKQPFNMPQTVEKQYVDSNGDKVDYKTSKQDYFSSYAKLLANQKQQVTELEEQIELVETAVIEYEKSSLTTLSDCYELESNHQNILNLVSTITDEYERAAFSQRIAIKYSELLKSLENWADVMAAYEAKAIQDKDAEEKQAALDALNAAQEQEKAANIEKFKTTIQIIMDTDIISESTYSALTTASNYLTQCYAYEEYDSLKSMYDNASSYIQTQRQKNEEDALREEAETKAEQERIEQQWQAEQDRLNEEDFTFGIDYEYPNHDDDYIVEENNDFNYDSTEYDSEN